MNVLVALLLAAMVFRRLLIGLAVVRLRCGGMILGEYRFGLACQVVVCVVGAGM